MQAFDNYVRKIEDLVTGYRQQLYQVVIVVGVLLVSAGVAYKITNQSQLRLLMLLMPAMVGLIFFMQIPGLGFIITLLGGIFIQYSGPSGLNVAMAGIALLIVIWLAKMVVVDREIRFLKSRAIRPILFFTVLSILSFGIGQLPFLPFARQAPMDAQLGGLAIFLLSAGTFLIAAHLFNVKWLEAFTWIFIAVGSAYMGGRLLSAMGVRIGRPFASGATTNSMFWVWLSAMAFAQAFLNKKLHIFVRILLIVFVVLLSYVAYVLSNDWKSGWVPTFITIAAIVGIRYWKATLLLAPIALIGGIAVATLIIATDEYSWGTRLDAWLIVVTMVFQTSPIFGLGFANYYWYSRYFPIRGYYVPFNSHSQYIDIFAQTGILGILCFLWIYLEGFFLGWKLRKQVPSGFLRGYVYGVMGGIVGTLVAAGLADWVLPFTYNIGLGGFRSSFLPWLFLGGLVCIEQAVRQKDTNEALSLVEKGV